MPCAMAALPVSPSLCAPSKAISPRATSPPSVTSGKPLAATSSSKSTAPAPPPVFLNIQYRHLRDITLGCPISRSLTTSCVGLELRPLPSTGITRLPRYYEPPCHPQCARPVPHGRPVDHP